MRRFARSSRVGDEIHLDLGLRRDDGADVAALDHDVALLAELPLPLAHHLAHRRVPRDDRDHPVDPRVADRRRDVGAGDPHAAVLVERDRLLPRQLGQQLGLAERNAPLHREPRQRAIHRAGVEVAEAEPLRERACHCALAGAGRPVDRNDHRLTRDSISSKNPGKLTATLSAP